MTSHLYKLLNADMTEMGPNWQNFAWYQQICLWRDENWKINI